ncbi:phosphoenolpyruvate carboxykinase-domain-containing protein [Suillus subalutaceus]|uniref:phosphoenolpyruvate carboxykinase-domain-containing protein n=1 Tax=Suillus subalutaceus TaxID=48586 RepID=UPI001B87A499|nr:phosphoenolpyruvate carboxykinase-domain-containing protein [Suillus subalutaceus]KAG1838722.1 phosphoenolpyruvate carboxykinase-domain-containing protein [Suillus subalutaceus]
MVHPHQTPYVTPHILHRHYAQASDNEFHNKLIGHDLEYFSQAGFDMDRIQLKRNAPVAQLYEDAIRNEGAIISSSGALINFSGKKTGRSPKDKRIVFEETSKDNIWWGSVNIKMDEHTFEINRERAIDYLNTRDNVYVFDGFAGWDPKYRIKSSQVLASPTSSSTMLVNFPANRFTKGMSSTTSVEINFKRMEMVILGTEYAGEMKKGVFSVMHYLQPVKFGQLSLHSSANVGMEKGDVTLFFGLSGTGKTTLSADPNRLLSEKEPEIYNAIRFGSILENVVYNPATRVPDYDDVSITENTRCAYPIEYIQMPRSMHVNFPPIKQAITSLLATLQTPGTEDGVLEPIPTFSTCTVLLSSYYTLDATQKCWLNACPTQRWTGGKVWHWESAAHLSIPVASSMPYTLGSFSTANTRPFGVFGLQIPTEVDGVPREVLNPSLAWTDKQAFEHEVRKLAGMFQKAFKLYEGDVQESVRLAGPRVD